MEMVESTAPRPELPVVEPPPPPGPNPLAGTQWDVRSVVGAFTTGHSTLEVAFGEDGELTITVNKVDGSSSEERERYRVDGDRLILTDDVGLERECTYRLFGDELRIDTPRAIVQMRSKGGSIGRAPVARRRARTTRVARES